MSRARIATSLLLSGLTALPASAGLFTDFYRGLEILSTPSGAPLNPVNGGGFQNGQRFGRLRVQPNSFGRGYRLEFDRNFGNDVSGRPEVFDFGQWELELSGPISSTASYTGRRFLVGNLSSSATGLDYTIRGKSGAQDVTVSGTFDLTQSLEINRFGFYTFNLDVSNDESQIQFTGLGVEGERNTNFDIGPINVRGNIFVDGLAAVLAGLGADTDFLEQTFPNSGIDRVTDAIREQFEAQLGDVAGLQLTAAERTAGPSQAGLVGPPVDLAAVEGAVDAGRDAGTVPEPTALVLVAAGGVAGALRLTRRRVAA